MTDKLNILLIEDEEAHAELIVRHLKMFDKYAVDWVKSISEARVFLNKNTPILIIADWRLPDGNAIELIPQKKELIKYPIIVMTSFGSEITAVEVIKAGVIDYIVKSADSFKNIYYTIERALREWGNITSRLNAELALKESEKRYKNLVENSPIGIYRTTPDGKSLMANPSIIKSLGYSCYEELINSLDIPTDVYLDMTDRQKFIEIIERDGVIRNFEAWWKVFNNHPILMRENAVAIRDENGKTIYYEGTAEDITERKKAEQEIFSIHQKNKALLQAIPDLIFIIDRHGTFIDFKAQNNDDLAIAFDNIIGTNIRKIGILQQSLKTIILHIEKAFETKEIQTCEYEILQPKGIFTYEARMVAMNDMELVSIVRNVTERKQSEVILINNEKRFRYLIENADDVISIIDKEGTIIYCTDIVEKKWGFKSKELIGKKVFERVHPDDLKNVENIFEKLIQYPEYSARAEYRLIHLDGKYRYAESIGANYLDNKLINGIVFTTREITQRIETEELKQNIAIAEKTAQIKQQFLANMSHEIRTPMNAIMGMLDLIKKTNLNEMQVDYIKTIQDASDNLLSIINDILDLSKIEAGKMELKINTFNIIETAKKIQKLFQENAKTKNIDFSINFTIDIPKYIKADENRIVQIVSNLVSNAFKFTKKGSVTVNFSITNRVEDKLQFLVEVIDTGIGISDNDQLRLFTKFNQLDNSLTRSQEGTGLGLAISKELSELMGGEIGVESEYGKGSSFWFSFNAIASEEKDCVSVKSNYGSFKDVRFNHFVLLVEDKFVNQKVATLMLESAGCSVVVANNGRESVDLICAGNKYDIIFMDIQMPIMDGVEAVGILRKKYKNLPPIIGLSANAMEGDAEKYIKLGMNDYLSKPFTTEQLKEKLYKWCKVE